MSTGICSKCGAPADGRSTLCKYCGSVIASAEPSILVIQTESDSPKPFRWVTIAVILLSTVIAGVVVAAGIRLSRSGTTLNEFSTTWNGHDTAVCEGNDEFSIENADVSLVNKTGIIARGNCHLKLKNCKIKSLIALEAEGNAQVTIENGTFVAERYAISARGNSKIILEGGHVEAKSGESIRAENNARVDVRGSKVIGNTSAQSNAQIIGLSKDTSKQQSESKRTNNSSYK